MDATTVAVDVAKLVFERTSRCEWSLADHRATPIQPAAICHIFDNRCSDTCRRATYFTFYEVRRPAGHGAAGSQRANG